MSYFTPPVLTATDQTQLLAQIKAYLQQLNRELNRTAASLESRTVVGGPVGQKAIPGPGFEGLKALILGSAQVVEAYSQGVETLLKGRYVAKSAFGTYREETNRQLLETARATQENLSSIRQIFDTLDQVVSTKESQGVLRLGELDVDEEGFPVIGLEVGQTRVEDGEVIFSKVARFTPQRLSFYDDQGREVAWISQQVLCIEKARITGRLDIGAFTCQVSDGQIITRFTG